LEENKENGDDGGDGYDDHPKLVPLSSWQQAPSCVLEENTQQLWGLVAHCCCCCSTPLVSVIIMAFAAARR
jgi:hypothetical protein